MSFYRPSRDLSSLFHNRPERPDSPDVSELRQMWACLECFLGRQWGFGPPLERKPGPAFLHCLRCDEVTRHTFAEVA